MEFFLAVSFSQLDRQDIDLQFAKMVSSSKRLKLAVIHEILPEEIIVFIFKKLDYRSMLQAQRVCKKWNEIINGFGLFNINNFGKELSKFIQK